MILKFPNLETVQLALTTGAVPAAVAGAAAVAGTSDDGVWVETTAALSRNNVAALRRFGVETVKTRGGAGEEAPCWALLLPLVAEANPTAPGDRTPVLFDVPGGRGLAALMSEMLRLGNDRQGYRWLEDGEVGRGLLRVIGPPYYSLLRAVDGAGPEAPTAFVEAAAGVWVQFGFRHPLAAQLKAPAGKLLLLRWPRAWTVLDEAPFRDVYETLEFTFPVAAVEWTDRPLAERVRVAPSLKAGGSAEGAELWVLRDEPVAELNRFVQNADDQLLHRLAFAVGEKGGATVIVVRVRPSKMAAPVLVLKAEGFKPYLKLPNLFLPVGTRLHPPLRRDVVRKLLAEDPARLTWLTPGGDGGFTPEQLPEDAFRPLVDWVDYVLERERETLQAWMQTTRFEFASFICGDDQPAKPKKPTPPVEKPRRGEGPRAAGDEAATEAPAIDVVDRSRKAGAADETVNDVLAAAPSELQVRLRTAEERFAAVEGNLDAAERVALWPELARLNSALGNVEDAEVCWLNGLWSEPRARADWVWDWFCAEAGKSQARASWAAGASAGRPVSGADLDQLLALGEPTTADVGALAAYLVWAAEQEGVGGDLKERLNPLARFLEAHENLLPVRGVWLAWLHLTRLSGGDALALARARDRLLERLHADGLRPEADLPSFLRFAGEPNAQRFRAVRKWMVGLAGQADEWVRENNGGLNALYPEPAPTAAYIDLIFAYGLARLGERDAALELLGRGKAVLAGGGDAHTLLFNAYEFRVRQALEGQKNTGPLPAHLLEYLEKMERQPRYIVDRLREKARILEPETRVSPYRHILARTSDLDRDLAELADLADKQEIVKATGRLLREVTKGKYGPDRMAQVLRAGLDLAPRVGEEFALDLLGRCAAAYDALPPGTEPAGLLHRAEFLEKVLFAAAHFDRSEYITPFVERFKTLLQKQRGPQAVQTLDSLAGQCFRGLRKLGMRDEIETLLALMADLVLEGKDVRAAAVTGPAASALLHVASGWYYFGRDKQAEPVLAAARGLLLHGDLAPREQTSLACTYAATLGQAPAQVAQARLEELLTAVRGVRDTYTTNTHFSVSQLQVVEAVVLAVVSDGFTLGSQSRRWLDEDELLVRRRIHRDLRAATAQA